MEGICCFGCFRNDVPAQSLALSAMILPCMLVLTASCTGIAERYLCCHLDGGDLMSRMIPKAGLVCYCMLLTAAISVVASARLSHGVH